MMIPKALSIIAILSFSLFSPPMARSVITQFTEPADSLHPYPSNKIPISLEYETFPAPLASSLRLPQGPVNMFLRFPSKGARFKMTFVDIPGGCDLSATAAYPGWCADRKTGIGKNRVHTVTLHSCFDADLPPSARKVNWNQVNYILNHAGNSKASDIQKALWRLIHGNGGLTPSAEKLVRDAKENGSNFIPEPGQSMAVICDGGNDKQLTFIEYGMPALTLPPTQPIHSLPLVPGALPLAGGDFLIPHIPLIPPIFPGEYESGGRRTPGGGGGDTPSTPEPASITLLLTGLVCLIMLQRYKKRRS